MARAIVSLVPQPDSLLPDPVVIETPPPPQCLGSPTGAHHWLFESSGKGRIAHGHCKYCKIEREGSNAPPVFSKGRMLFDVIFVENKRAKSRRQV